MILKKKKIEKNSLLPYGKNIKPKKVFLGNTKVDAHEPGCSIDL